MEIKKILGECLFKLGEDNFINKASYTDKEQIIVDKLLQNLNITYKEIISEYLPLIVDENVMLINNEIDLSILNKNIIYPIRLTKQGNKRLLKSSPFSIKSDFSGDGVLSYAYMPESLLLENSISDMRLTSSIMCDGILANYYFQDRIFELAESYDNSFRSKISMLRYKGREMNVKPRGWNS